MRLATELGVLLLLSAVSLTAVAYARDGKAGEVQAGAVVDFDQRVRSDGVPQRLTPDGHQSLEVSCVASGLTMEGKPVLKCVTCKYAGRNSCGCFDHEDMGGCWYYSCDCCIALH